MDARQLEYFVAVVEHGGFSRAAAALHVAQPSLSQAIAGLETDLGVPLFHRVGRGVELSAAGRELLAPARRALRDMAAVRDAAAALNGLRRGTVEVATMPSPGIEPLTTLIRRFADRHPGPTVTAHAAFTAEEVLRLVRTGACELGLLGTAGPPAAPGLDVVALGEQAFVVVADAETGPGGVRDGRPVTPAELARLRLVVSRPGSMMRGLVDEITDGAAEIAAVVDHRTTILPLVLAGVGAAVLPEAWAGLAHRCGAAVAPVDHPARLRIALVSRRDHVTPAARAFRHLARELADGP
ncbi:LysR family transcriptional regulator [Streptomyces sp. 4N509B]|uniref:LysR family transcriptional regulator n=1 Tax=Streptomyces sp. 4N509B TaxID=3457413 RepID=UPI003FD0F458